MLPETVRAHERAELQDAAAALDLQLEQAQIDRLIGYQDLLLKWNRVYNLTAVRDPDAMRVQHLVDSLAVVTPLRRVLRGSGRVLDVGSGGGLPGLVIAIAAAEVAVTCVDAVAKKVSFVRQVAAELGLSNLRALHARVEQVKEPAFDCVTSRAFASLGDFTRLTRHLIAPGGCWMAMKGRRPDDEIGALSPEVETFHVEHVVVPGLDAERCLVWMRPASAPD